MPIHAHCGLGRDRGPDPVAPNLSDIVGRLSRDGSRDGRGNPTLPTASGTTRRPKRAGAPIAIPRNDRPDIRIGACSRYNRPRSRGSIHNRAAPRLRFPRMPKAAPRTLRHPAAHQHSRRTQSALLPVRCMTRTQLCRLLFVSCYSYKSPLRLTALFYRSPIVLPPGSRPLIHYRPSWSPS